MTGGKADAANRLSVQLGSPRLAGYATLLLLVIGIVQLGASVLFYEAIDRQAIREDHARRVAEMLVVSERVYRHEAGETGAVMTSRYLQVRITPQPGLSRSGAHSDIADIRSHIVRWEPSLADRPMLLDIVRGEARQQDLVGAMRLPDGRWLNFRSHDISSGWAIVLRATMMTLLITGICIVAGFLVLRFLTAPLRELSRAAATLGHGSPVAVHESGASDLRSLARSFNSMQARIAGLEDDQARSFEAISHDLRTPLARLQLASDFVGEGDIGRIVRSSADEMEAMLMSLQRFLRAEHLEAQAETLDLTALVRSMIAPLGEQVTLEAPTGALALSYREPLTLALDALIENALHYGSAVIVSIRHGEARWEIEIADNGPGIPEDCFERVLDPFFRVDEARARNTAGFGLGIPMAHRLLRRFGGSLRFRNAAAGGLIAQILVPGPAESGAGGE